MKQRVFIHVGPENMTIDAIVPVVQVQSQGQDERTNERTLLK